MMKISRLITYVLCFMLAFAMFSVAITESTKQVQQTASKKVFQKSEKSKFSNALQLLKEKKLDEAAKLFEELLTEDSGNPAVYYYNASFKFLDKDYDAAIEYLDLGLELDENNLRIMKLKARVHMEKMEYDTAINVLENYLELDSNDAGSWTSLSMAHLSVKDYESSVKTAEEALNLDSKNVLALTISGFALMGVNNYEDALYMFDTALKYNPKNTAALKGKEQARTLMEGDNVGSRRMKKMRKTCRGRTGSSSVYQGISGRKK